MFATFPLTDITNIQYTSTKENKQLPVAKKVRRNDPYSWKCLPDEASNYYEVEDVNYLVPAPQELFQEKGDQAPAAPTGPPICTALVQFKCHQAEYSSSIIVEKGQYVVVRGDRGIDIGVVIRINNPKVKTYVERTGPVDSVLRHATQREVDYWATDLKEAEHAAVSYCQSQVFRHGFDMEIVHAEYQFDKKKLTFYYEARTRIDFVQLLKELYREFGCRIWMEKVRLSE
ncbi:hypothetical protein STCU_01318 [Strigomonas culicis]|uniref:PSP1 C-terminal domain-containing protein n=1 Tax=Strigomonas culicis TaxID=28005 RepID=S9V182_9TRYP|nr:hypothetical protein STCU_03214 [Strigomonas culicis]EPY34784.1 hypothetical protein STCU_01318 [Strigomonas culicis]|eukprot:EPY31811.1 hypothetical protein STCU_03214 [Strigomonas culicis]